MPFNHNAPIKMLKKKKPSFSPQPYLNTHDTESKETFSLRQSQVDKQNCKAPKDGITLKIRWQFLNTGNTNRTTANPCILSLTSLIINTLKLHEMLVLAPMHLLFIILK